MDFKAELIAQALVEFKLRTPMRPQPLSQIADRPGVTYTFGFGRGDPRCVWILGRMVSATASNDRCDLPFATFLAQGFPVEIGEALGAEVVDRVRGAVLALDPLPCRCGTGFETSSQHGSLEYHCGGSVPGATIDDDVAVERCTVCGRGWFLEKSGDSHYSYDFQVEPVDLAGPSSG